MEVVKDNRGKRTHTIRIIHIKSFKSKSLSIVSNLELDKIKAKIEKALTGD